MVICNKQPPIIHSIFLQSFTNHNLVVIFIYYIFNIYIILFIYLLNTYVVKIHSCLCITTFYQNSNISSSITFAQNTFTDSDMKSLNKSPLLKPRNFWVMQNNDKQITSNCWILDYRGVQVTLSTPLSPYILASRLTILSGMDQVKGSWLGH